MAPTVKNFRFHALKNTGARSEIRIPGPGIPGLGGSIFGFPYILCVLLLAPGIFGSRVTIFWGFGALFRGGHPEISGFGAPVL